MKLDINKSGFACHCPDRQMEKMRGGSFSATGAFIHLTPRGKAMELDINLSTGSEFYNFLNNKKRT
ncbi:hypothetical protein MKX96_10565 [Psychrobacillus sp. FSL W7-1493]